MRCWKERNGYEVYFNFGWNIGVGVCIDSCDCSF